MSSPMFGDDTVGNPSLKIVSRKKWGALPPKFTEPLPLPAKRMMFICTNTERCMDKDECCLAMRTMQKYYMEEKGMPDIPYSFLIGGDLRVYEGRGWGVMIRRRDIDDWVDERVVFGFIQHERKGDKRLDKMIQKAYDLMDHAILNNYLVDFDQYSCQDEEAAKWEVKQFKKEMEKDAEKSCMKNIERENKKSEKNRQGRKKWEKTINDLHYEDARPPSFLGDKKELEEALKENKEYLDSVKNWKDMLKESDSESLDSDDLIRSSGEEDRPL